MVPAGLLAAVGIGVVSAFVLGVVMTLVGTDAHRDSDGISAISLVVAKSDYLRGEPVSFMLTNTADAGIRLGDIAAGWGIAGLDGTMVYISPDDISDVILGPSESIEGVWVQEKQDGDAAHPGIYRILFGDSSVVIQVLS